MVDCEAVRIGCVGDDCRARLVVVPVIVEIVKLNGGIDEGGVGEFIRKAKESCGAKGVDED